MLLELSAEVVAGVQANIADEPGLAVEGNRLRVRLRGGSGAEKREHEGSVWLRDDLGGIWAAGRE